MSPIFQMRNGFLASLFLTLTFWKRTGPLFCRMTLNLGIYTLFFFFFGSATQHAGSQLPDQGSNPRVLTTGPLDRQESPSIHTLNSYNLVPCSPYWFVTCFSISWASFLWLEQGPELTQVRLSSLVPSPVSDTVCPLLESFPQCVPSPSLSLCWPQGPRLAPLL